MDVYDKEIGDTLAQVNVVRQAMGFEALYDLPNAHRGAPAACLYYRALADCGAKSVYGDRIVFSSERQAQLAADLWGSRADGTNVQPPAQMQRTITRFDNGDMPYYFENS